jgi:hypothetical protein
MNAAVKKQYFTVDEANRRLPLVRAIVQDIVDLYRDVHDRRDRLARIRQLPGASRRNDESVYGEELRQIEQELEKDLKRLNDFVTELQELGVEFKDPVAGLVDFPTMIDGREAYLCWRLGEDEIAFWHDLDAGFQGRQSLMETSLPGERSFDADNNEVG